MASALISVILLFAFQVNPAPQSKPYSSQKQPLHSWDIFMASPDAIANAKKTLGHCGDAENQAVMNACNKLEAETADAQLNHLYHDYWTKLDAPGRVNLQRIERLWLQYRDLQCKEDASQFEGGSLQPTEFYACMTAVTQQRVADMNAAYGDLDK